MCVTDCCQWEEAEPDFEIVEAGQACAIDNFPLRLQRIVAPVKFASLLMGAWFLANAAANYLGGWLAAQTERIPSQATFFSIPVATSLGAAALLLLLVPVLKRLTKTVKA